MRFWVDEIPIDEGAPNDERQAHVPTASRDGNRALVTPERSERGSPHKKPLRGIRAEEVLVEQVIVRMIVIRGDTSPKVEASVNRGTHSRERMASTTKAVQYT